MPVKHVSESSNTPTREQIEQSRDFHERQRYRSERQGVLEAERKAREAREKKEK